MTDFRRPDLDLWEEEEDADDARPTIVAERPTADQPDVRLLGTRSESRAPRESANPSRSSLVQRLIEQGALEDEVPRPSVEALRNSEVDELTLIEKEPFALAYAVRQTEIAQVESESPTEDAVPTVSVKRPLSSANTPLPAPAPLVVAHAPLPESGTPLPRAPLPGSGTPLPFNVALPGSVTPLPARAPLPASVTPLPARAPRAEDSGAAPPLAVGPKLAPPAARADRDVTERISIPNAGMVGSIAPATRTFRPSRPPSAGWPVWQTALAAVLLLGGGLTIAKLRDDRGRSVSATSIATPRVEASQLPEPALPVASPAAAPTPAPEAPAPVAEAPAEPVQPVPSAVPEPILLPPPAKEDPANAARKLPRGTRVERRALASEPRSELLVSAREAPAPVPEAAPEPAAPSEAPAAPALPAQPSREDVSAALNAVVPALQKCVGDRHDTADVTLTVRPAGFVSYAVVSGPYAGSAEGSCIARAVKAAKFPAFSDSSVRINYPFQL